MATPNLIVVLGATGQQGGSVVNTFLAQPTHWRVRGITRNKTSAKAQTLASRGVEVVEADMSTPSTLTAAFRNAHAIFAVSDFLGIYFDPKNADRPKPGQALNAWVAEEEARQLRNVIDAAAEVEGLERFVFSSLSNASKWSKGKYTHIYHFDSKASAEEYGRREHPSLWAKTSVFQGGIFLNFFTSPAGRPQKSPNGTLTFTIPWPPTLQLPWLVPSEDTGPLVHALIQSSPEQSLLGYREWASTHEIAAKLSTLFNVPTKVVKADPEAFWAEILSPGLVQEFTEFFEYWEEFVFEAQESPRIVRPDDLEIKAQLPGIEGWIKKQSWGFD
ncbi:hypothetical protein M409DRAFT_54016 [Zasmidium cellare ATCC 36951]|uniref:NmrA-like domain-containing protein n=1 Tax=Zasmidium cellare ATCC 36951 TaxID=1080233 RepID=A0A6A6CJT0_ZASCE|nr:uncharacterized protein M409DRAFT_54016 [Zasmidium cellare ATCC 36951]KAF2167415.1 hypothetical protein M409DRAFT_54016 [Zasmidium cellare ATCC 36951]